MSDFNIVNEYVKSVCIEQQPQLQIPIDPETSHLLSNLTLRFIGKKWKMEF